MGFHHTFLNILLGKDPLDQIQPSPQFDFNVLPQTPETISKIAPYVLKKVKTKQQLIETHDLFYVARDINTNTIYMCFKDLLMLDIDEVEPNKAEPNDKHLSRLSDSPEKFVVFQSNRGLHAFCVSRKYEYRNVDTIKFMLDNGSDFYYTAFCYIRGYCVRLNKKISEPFDKPIYVRLGYFGKGKIIKELDSLVDKHVEYFNLYSTSSFNSN